VILSVEGGAVRMVATDSYRMSVTARNLREALEVGKRAMVATRRLPEAARIAALCEWLAVAT
jgi:DNA polymerase III sliding clamp (beta) subunit (PCNA family)